ncbi:hypothetical protein BOC55_27405 [Burkholderia pseudomallei]|nr:hypothetical protein BOC48_34910 [Burkholderia pseudomallei]ARL76272.1 hypothetical protein BOC54_29090 [Burkholderia pseudomallei]ARL82876.1 hypothetical protein BOC55_27405 [Burkholderia pseudomallei]
MRLRRLPSEDERFRRAAAAVAAVRHVGMSACRRRDRWRIALPSLARSRARSRFWRCRAASVGGANRIARNGRVVCYRAQSGRHSRCGS